MKSVERHARERDERSGGSVLRPPGWEMDIAYELARASGMRLGEEEVRGEFRVSAHESVEGVGRRGLERT